MSKIIDELNELAAEMGAGHLECRDRILEIAEKYKNLQTAEEAAAHEYANHPIVNGFRMPD